MALTEQEVRAMVARGDSRIVGEAPSTSDSPDALLLTKIQRLAKQYAWQGLHTYNPAGTDKGLHCILVREVVIFAYVLRDGGKLTMPQEAWLQALRRTKAVETYVWYPKTWPEIEARLIRKGPL